MAFGLIDEVIKSRKTTDREGATGTNGDNASAATNE